MPSILIVDDEPNIRRMVGALLGAEGYEVRDASDATAGLARAVEYEPDLVLLDLMIPGRDGYEVCQTIRADPACARTKIVMLTARSREVEREKGLALGADDYITKPFSTRELVERVRRHLDPSRA